MKTLALVFALLFTTAAASVFDFKLQNIDGGKLSLSKYRGKKILIVNTASKCGFTKVTFPMSTKVSVKGDDISPLFKYLTEAENPDFTGDIKWNFEKFLIDENGKLIRRYRSQTTPLDPAITSAL